MRFVALCAPHSPGAIGMNLTGIAQRAGRAMLTAWSSGRCTSGGKPRRRRATIAATGLCRALVLVAAFPTAAVCQPGSETIELAETVELPRLVDLCASRLGVNIEYDVKLAGSATLRLHREMTDAGLLR